MKLHVSNDIDNIFLQTITRICITLLPHQTYPSSLHSLLLFRVGYYVVSVMLLLVYFLPLKVPITAEIDDILKSCVYLVDSLHLKH